MFRNKEFIAVVTSKTPVRSGLKGGRKEYQERGVTSKVATPVTKPITPTTDSRKITTSTANSDRSERKTPSTISEPRKTIGATGATTNRASRDYQPVSFSTTISTDRNTTERATTDRTSTDRKDNTSKTTTPITSTGRSTRPSSSTYIPTLNNVSNTCSPNLLFTWKVW